MRIRSALALLSLSACRLTLHDDVTVDGVRLTARHEEVLTLESWPENGLVIEARQGDVRVEHAEGPTTIHVLLHERELGQAHALLENGTLVARAGEGVPCAIGRVTVRTGGPALGLRLGTGLGDVELSGVRVEGDLVLETGMGDVTLHGPGEPRSIELATGMGDVDATHVRCARFSAESGMGDVRVDGLEAEEVVLSSGMGDIDVERSRGGRLGASSGMGDVDLAESSFAIRELDSGLGRVRER